MAISIFKNSKKIIFLTSLIVYISYKGQVKKLIFIFSYRACYALQIGYFGFLKQIFLQNFIVFKSNLGGVKGGPIFSPLFNFSLLVEINLNIPLFRL